MKASFAVLFSEKDECFLCLNYTKKNSHASVILKYKEKCIHYNLQKILFSIHTLTKDLVPSSTVKQENAWFFSSTPLDPVCPNLFLRPSPLICAQRFFNLWFALRPFSTANSDRSCPERIFPGRYALTKRWTCCELLRWAVRHVVEIHLTNFRISKI